MKQQGKKALAWKRALPGLIKEAVADGILSIDNGYPEGKCKDCKKWKPLTPDHNIRRSQGGSHHKSNIDWVCVKCHRKRDQEGDPMDKKKKSKKPKWMTEHQCKNCKKLTEMYLCHHCRKASV